MIYSRSPEQYDPAPCIDPSGKRWSSMDAPRNSKHRSRRFFEPSSDMTPVVDTFSGDRLTVANALALVDLSPGNYLRYLWMPRDRDRNRHNVILSSVRTAASSGNRALREHVLDWVETLNNTSEEMLIMFSPGTGIDRNKIADAKKVLGRLANLYTEKEGAEFHGAFSS